MIDRNSQFMAILTNVGAAKLANANALGIPWNLTELGVGDANGTDPMPSATQTKLINEQRRAPLNQLRVDPVNAAVIIAEQVIPADVGGWWIREIGLYDSDGDLVAVSNCAPSFKPSLDQGSGRTQIVRMNFIVSSINNIVLKIDPAIVLATREYVDLAITEAINKQDFKHSVLVATTANIALTGIQTIDGVLLSADTRVLVKNQTQAKDNGIYVVPASGAWKRAQDADTSIEVTPGLFVHVEKGAANGDSVWQLVTDAPIVLGTTPLAFEMIAGSTGVVAGTYRSLTVDKNGRVMAGTNPTTLADYQISDAYRRTEVDFLLSGKANNAITLAGYGIGDAYTKTAVDSFLAGKANKATTLVGYGIGDAYTKTAVDDLLAGKAAKANTLGGYGIVDAVSSNNDIPIVGKVADVDKARFINGNPTATTDLPPAAPYVSGIHAKYNGGKYAFTLVGSMTSRDVYGRCTVGDGTGNWFRFWTDANFTPSPKNTALLEPTGWSKNADTGEISQTIEVTIGDISGTNMFSVIWPFQFPNKFLSASIAFKTQSASGNCACQASYYNATVNGCSLRVDEWASVVQTGLIAVVTARGC